MNENGENIVPSLASKSDLQYKAMESETDKLKPTLPETEAYADNIDSENSLYNCMTSTSNALVAESRNAMLVLTEQERGGNNHSNMYKLESNSIVETEEVVVHATKTTKSISQERKEILKRNMNFQLFPKKICCNKIENQEDRKHEGTDLKNHTNTNLVQMNVNYVEELRESSSNHLLVSEVAEKDLVTDSTKVTCNLRNESQKAFHSLQTEDCSVQEGFDEKCLEKNSVLNENELMSKRNTANKMCSCESSAYMDLESKCETCKCILSDRKQESAVISKEGQSECIEVEVDKENNANLINTYGRKNLLIPTHIPQTMVPQGDHTLQIGENQFQSGNESNSKMTTGVATETMKPSAKKEFVSDDPQENADNNNPEWEILRKLETDEERYKAVRKRWRSLTIPHPNNNLTYVHQRYGSIQGKIEKQKFSVSNSNKKVPLKNTVPPNTLKPANTSRKRSRTMEESLSFNGPEPKRSRSQSCTSLFDRKVEELKKNVENEKKRLIEEERVAVRKLEICQRKENMQLFSTRSHSFAFNRLQDVLYQRQLQDIGNLHQHYADAMMSAEAACRNKFDSLMEAMKEVQLFHSFYEGLDADCPNKNCLFLSNKEIEDVLESDGAQEKFATYYR